MLAQFEHQFTKNYCLFDEKSAFVKNRDRTSALQSSRRGKEAVLNGAIRDFAHNKRTTIFPDKS